MYTLVGQIWISQPDMSEYRANAIDLRPRRTTPILRKPKTNVRTEPKVQIFVENVFSILSLIGNIKGIKLFYRGTLLSNCNFVYSGVSATGVDKFSIWIGYNPKNLYKNLREDPIMSNLVPKCAEDLAVSENVWFARGLTTL